MDVPVLFSQRQPAGVQGPPVLDLDLATGSTDEVNQ
jgi:hypothetical protein